MKGKIQILTVVMLGFSIVTNSVMANSVFDLPEYTITDNNFVNMSTGDVYHSFTDVKIGGAMGLNHSVSTTGTHSDVRTNSYVGGMKVILGPKLVNGSYEKLIATKGYSNEKFRINADGSFSSESNHATALNYVQGIGYV